MDPARARLVVLAAAALIVVATGTWLSRAGRPYGTALLAAHKLLALAATVAVVMLVVQAGSAGVLGPLGIGVAAVTAALVIALFASGGVVSAAASPAAWAVLLHRFGPYPMVALMAFAAAAAAGVV